MKRYELKIRRYDTFCELCSEYHEYIDCPLCDGDILEIYERKVAHCSGQHLFSVWSNKDGNVELIECEYIWKAKFAKVKCGHLEVKQVVGMGYDCCCEESCPLLALSLAHFRESISM